MSRNVEDTVIQLERAIQQMTRSMDSLIEKYLGIVAKQQFDVNVLVAEEDYFNSSTGIADLHGKINQMCVIETIAWVIPNGTTSLTIQIGRFSHTIANPATVYSWPFLKKIVGQGDQIKATIAPVGAGTFSVFGYKTGNTQQL